MPVLTPVDMEYEDIDNADSKFFKNGEFALIKLAKKLNDKKFNAILLNDRIYCNKKVIIYEEKNNLRIEGILCPEYYEIRDIVYSEYFKI